MSNNKNVDTAPGIGQKLEGAKDVVHGIGENIRGRFMDTVDSTTNTGNAHPETLRGRLEVEQGMAKMTGGRHAATASARAPTSGAGGAPASSSAYPPSQYQSQGQVSGDADAPPAQEGDVLGPRSGMTAGSGNAGPESSIAYAPYQKQYYAGGASAAGSGTGRQGSNGRDLGYDQNREQPTVVRQQGGMLGPEPDRHALGSEPGHLP
ncbi:hypothetical protein C8Q74DRAFT_381883 [Fomes fomentarius]|nr:hypothetical protein C8Q74DRAFT_381883 [Fomes fomentarius]